jgi:hypothetical protein
LIKKSSEAGMEVKTVIGDAAYSEKGNIELTKKNQIKLVAKLNPIVTQGNRKKKTNLNSIKMPECMFVRQAIWQFGKHVT